MSVVQEVKDGKLVEAASSQKDKVKRPNSSLDKEAFLQLLVAQMKYQDPLEPTSNTEYISQLATFSSLEEMQNLNAGMTLQRASQLVGQYVYLKTTDSSGVETFPEGAVDYVTYENGKAFLSVGGKLYSIDDLLSVADSTYVLAAQAVEKFMTMMEQLPSPKLVGREDGVALGNLIITYESMNDYQKSLVSEEAKELYAEYLAQYQTHIVAPVSGFIKALEELPAVENLTQDNLADMESLVGTYKDFTSYQISLIDKKAAELYEQVYAKYQELKG